jgi:hypothetical protein
VGPRAVLEAVVNRKIPSPYRDSNSLIIQPVAQRYTTVKVLETKIMVKLLDVL